MSEADEPRRKSRTPRLSVAGLIETVRIREAAEALDKHRKRVVYAMGGALIARLILEVHYARRLGASEDLASALTSVSLVVIVYVAALWFMALRGHDRFGFGIGLGLAVIEATSQLVGLIRSMPAAADLWPVLLVILTHVLLALAAFQASRDFPSESSSGPWVKGFIVATLFIIAMPALRSRVMRSAGGQERVLTRPTVPSAALQSSLDVVHRCARAYQQANPATGYPRRLAAMGPGGSGCITDSLIVQGEGAGWMFRYAPGERDPSGRTTSYELMARQSAAQGQGVGFFVSDQTGVVRPARRTGR